MWTEQPACNKDHALLFVAFPSWVAPGPPTPAVVASWLAPPAPKPRMEPSPPARIDADVDLQRVRDTVQTLRTSGYYYEGLSWQDADRLLRPTPTGTFLVRDSADARFLFALSVQTERGPTSVRIHYAHGEFRLDCEDALSRCMPWFPCVVRLVEYYVELSQSAKGHMCVWLDGNGRRDLPIRLVRPLYRTVRSLQHLCRVAVSRRLTDHKSPQSLPLPSSLKHFLVSYPHRH